MLFEELSQVVEFLAGDLLEQSGELVLPQFAVLLDGPLQLTTVQHDEADVGDSVLLLGRMRHLVVSIKRKEQLLEKL